MVEIKESLSSPLSNISTESLCKSKRKLENCSLNALVRVTSLKSSVNTTAPALLASVHAVDCNKSSQCAVRFPKIHLGITSGDCHYWHFKYLLCFNSCHTVWSVAVSSLLQQLLCLITGCMGVPALC